MSCDLNVACEHRKLTLSIWRRRKQQQHCFSFTICFAKINVYRFTVDLWNWNVDVCPTVSSSYSIFKVLVSSHTHTSVHITVFFQYVHFKINQILDFALYCNFLFYRSFKEKRRKKWWALGFGKITDSKKIIEWKWLGSTPSRHSPKQSNDDDNDNDNDDNQ